MAAAKPRGEFTPTRGSATASAPNANAVSRRSSTGSLTTTCAPASVAIAVAVSPSIPAPVDDDDRAVQNGDLRGGLDRSGDGRGGAGCRCEHGGRNVIRDRDHRGARENVGVGGEPARKLPAPAHPFVPVALHVHAFLAEPAAAPHAASARNGHRPHDPLAERDAMAIRRLRTALAECDHPADLFVAEDERRRGRVMPENGVHIRPAHGRQFDLDQRVPRARAGPRERRPPRARGPHPSTPSLSRTGTLPPPCRRVPEASSTRGVTALVVKTEQRGEFGDAADDRIRSGVAQRRLVVRARQHPDDEAGAGRRFRRRCPDAVLPTTTMDSTLVAPVRSRAVSGRSGYGSLRPSAGPSSTSARSSPPSDADDGLGRRRGRVRW